MKHIYRYDDYINEQQMSMMMINEKWTWKDIKKYGTNVLVALIVGFSFTPEEYKDPIILKALKSGVSVRLRTFDDIKDSKIVQEAVNRVISKVENSKVITNKDELVNRLKNISFKHYSKTFLLPIDNAMMMYYYDESGDIDYIIISNEKYEDKLDFYVHELNHLIDRHKKVSKISEPSNAIIKDFNRETYTDFFKGWPMLDRDIAMEMIISDKDKIGIPNTEKISIGDFYYSQIQHSTDYFLSDSEIYARLSTMKSLLLGLEHTYGGIDINDPITEKSIRLLINEIKRIVLEEESDTEEILLLLKEFDWIIYTPIIDYNSDDLNLFTMNNNNNNNNNKGNINKDLLS
tara:strand:+ start:48235 stop:49275 length:1041 start_codon:yes stop_codon:yes gene_type:complete